MPVIAVEGTYGYPKFGLTVASRRFAGSLYQK